MDNLIMSTIASYHNCVGKSSEIVANNLHLDTNDISLYLSSPISILMALLYLLNGASGNTRKNILNYLQISDDDVATLTHTTLAFINNTRKTPQVKTVNLLLVDKAFTPNDTYKKLADKLGKYIDVDFANDNVAIVNNVNHIIENATDGDIKNMIDNNICTPSTTLLLVNIIHVKLEWDIPFIKNHTYSNVFTTLSGDRKNVYMMSRKNSSFMYHETDEYQTVIIPCIHNFSAVFMLPKKQASDILKKSFAPSDYLVDMKERRGSVYIPRFKIEHDLDIVNILKNGGLDGMFCEKAEFNNICPVSGLYVNDMKHKVVIEMTETGIKASAVTLVAMWQSYSPEPKNVFRFNANKSFRYQILQDSNFGQIVLFDGIYDGQGVSEYGQIREGYQPDDIINKYIEPNSSSAVYKCITIVLILSLAIVCLMYCAR